MRKYSYLLSLFVALALTIVLAQKSHAVYDPNPKHSKWFHDSIVNDPLNKSTVKVEAQKTYPVSTLDQNGKPIKQIRNAKATIKLGANAGNVGKSLLKRAPHIAITQAVTALLLKSVDWVMDEKNNGVRYTAKETDEDVWCKTSVYKPSECSKDYMTLLKNQCTAHGSGYSFDEILPVRSDGSYYARCKPGGGATAYPVKVNEPAQDIIIPINDIADKIIEQAAAGEAPAMQVMNDAALDALEAGLLDSQLDAASNVPQPDPQAITQAQYDNPDYPEAGTGSGTGPETPTDPETPTNPEAKPFELPPFCSWASKVCDFIDWVKTEPSEPQESGEVDVEIPDSNMHEGILERLYINMPAQCPPDPILEFMGAKIPFPMSVFCQFAEMMKPLILLFAYIKGLSIIGNGLT